MRHYFTLLFLIALSSGSFLSDSELQSQRCFSRARGLVSRITIAHPPTSPIDLIEVGTSFRKFRINCFQVLESPPQLPDWLAVLCNTPPSYLVCLSNSFSNPDMRNWTCTSATEYWSNPSTERIFGELNGPQRYLKLQWSNTLGVGCYPRDLTSMLVSEELKPVEGSLGALIAFAIIGVIVAFLVGLFGTYQLKKVMSKLRHREKRRDIVLAEGELERDAAATNINQHEPLFEEEDHKVPYRVQGDTLKFPSEYETTAAGEKGSKMSADVATTVHPSFLVRSRGTQIAPLQHEDGVTVTIRSTPFLKPWYDRHTFVSPPPTMVVQEERRSSRRVVESIERTTFLGSAGRGKNPVPPTSINTTILPNYEDHS